MRLVRNAIYKSNSFTLNIPNIYNIYFLFCEIVLRLLFGILVAETAQSKLDRMVINEIITFSWLSDSIQIKIENKLTLIIIHLFLCVRVCVCLGFVFEMSETAARKYWLAYKHNKIDGNRKCADHNVKNVKAIEFSRF